MLKNKNSRRHFIKQTTFTILTAGSARSYAANEKLNIGIIGVFNRGKANLDGVKNENITALCDVDSNFLSAQSRNFPKANQYADFRRMIDSENLDALVVSSPDQTHAVATSFGLNNGLHTYCEKPLTHTISECRTITNLAREKNLVTQMGTQIHAGENYRRVVELLNSNAIGKVNEVHGVECPIYYDSPKGWAGTADLVATYESQLSICDFKQKNSIMKESYSSYHEYMTQISGYSLAHDKLFGSTITQGVILLATTDLVFQIFRIDHEKLKEYQQKFLDRVEQYYSLINK